MKLHVLTWIRQLTIFVVEQEIFIVSGFFYIKEILHAILKGRFWTFFLIEVA